MNNVWVLAARFGCQISRSNFQLSCRDMYVVVRAGVLSCLGREHLSSIFRLGHNVFICPLDINEEQNLKLKANLV